MDTSEMWLVDSGIDFTVVVCSGTFRTKEDGAKECTAPPRPVEGAAGSRCPGCGKTLVFPPCAEW